MKHNTIDQTIKEFREKFVRGVPAQSLPNGEVQEAEAWIEADIEDVEGFIRQALVQQHTQDIEAFEKVLDNTSFNTRCEQCDTNATNITQILSKLKEVQG